MPPTQHSSSSAPRPGARSRAAVAQRPATWPASSVTPTARRALSQSQPNALGLAPTSGAGPKKRRSPAGADQLNEQVFDSRGDKHGLLMIVKGIENTEEFLQLEAVSIVTVMRALCEVVYAELDAEPLSLETMLWKVAAMIMACDNYPDTTRQQFEHWGAMVSPLAEKLEAR